MIVKMLGGLALFLYGMEIMGDGLKASSAGALKKALERVTSNTVKAFILGALITAVIQSSTATIVLTVGLIGAGVLDLDSASPARFTGKDAEGLEAFARLIEKEVFGRA